MDPTASTVIAYIALIGLTVAGSRQAARRKGRTLAWGAAAFFFPLARLLLELLPSRAPPNRPPVTKAGLFLECIACFVALLALGSMVLAMMYYHP
jgi:hypothetical protein